MYHTQKFGNDLKDVIETLNELKQAVEQQAKARVQLEAEKAALARRLSEALAAERRQRRRATASRAIAKRAQAATKPVIATCKELVNLKRALAAHKKNAENEKRILEDKISSLQEEIIRAKEESEAALAAVDFAKEVAAVVSKDSNEKTNTASTSTPTPAVPSMSRTLLSQSTSTGHYNPPVPLQRPRTGNSVWTGTGHLAWNTPPVTLALKTIDRGKSESQRLNIRQPVSQFASRPKYLPLTGFQTASQLMAHFYTEDKENEVSNSQVSQSCGVEKRSQTLESDDECIIIGEKEMSVNTAGYDEVPKETCTSTDSYCEPSVKIEREYLDTEINSEEIDFYVTEDPAKREKKESNSPANSVKNIPVKKSKKKRKMYIKPFEDDFIA